MAVLTDGCRGKKKANGITLSLVLGSRVRRRAAMKLFPLAPLAACLVLASHANAGEQYWWMNDQNAFGGGNGGHGSGSQQSFNQPQQQNNNYQQGQHNNGGNNCKFIVTV